MWALKIAELQSKYKDINTRVIELNQPSHKQQHVAQTLFLVCCFQYETAMGYEHPGGLQSSSEEGEVLPPVCENPSIQPVAYHMVNRRYSEFLNLQTRLEEKNDLRKLIKGSKDGSVYVLFVFQSKSETRAASWRQRWAGGIVCPPLALRNSCTAYKQTWICS